MNDIEQFELECDAQIERLASNAHLQKMTRDWYIAASANRYTYNFRALGLPIIQNPQDIVALQEIIWATRPTLIIETGVARGGSLIWSAAMLTLLDHTDGIGAPPGVEAKPSRRVVGIDIDIRPHNRAAIEAHPLSGKIELISGSSIEPSVVETVRARVGDDDRVMVILDSNHTGAHVLAELRAYAPLVSQGNYCIVCDTVVELLPDERFADRPWGKGDNPLTAVGAFMAEIAQRREFGADQAGLVFEVDRRMENKLLITSAPNGFLRRMIVG